MSAALHVSYFADRDPRREAAAVDAAARYGGLVRDVAEVGRRVDLVFVFRPTHAQESPALARARAESAAADLRLAGWRHVSVPE